MMNFIDYIAENGLALIPALIVVGQLLKSIPKYPDWLIPWALLLLGVLGSGLLNGFTVDGVVQGILIAGSAVYGNQLYKQTAERDS